jgi:ribosomal protein L40E
MRCRSCNYDKPNASFCKECGAKLELICPACKASVSPGARFCKKCGTAIGPGKAAASTTVPATSFRLAPISESTDAIVERVRRVNLECLEKADCRKHFAHSRIEGIHLLQNSPWYEA